MDLRTFLKDKNITGYGLSKGTSIPYTTINDLINGKTKVSNISLKYAVSIADYLHLEIHELLKLDNVEFEDFRYFRNNTLHELKREGNTLFVEKVIKDKRIDYYYKHDGIEYALYLLALLDYLCRIDNKSIYERRYNTLRKEKLKNTFYIGSDLIHFESIEDAEKELGIKVIPEFKKYNIIEENVFNVA